MQRVSEVVAGRKGVRSSGMKSASAGLLLVLFSSMQLAAQADTGPAPSLFTWRDAVLAGAFMGGALALRPLDQRYADKLQDSSTQDSRRLHKISQFVRTTTAPGGYIIGASMYAVGRLTRNDRLATLGFRGTEALVIGEAVGGVIKGTVGRQRPYVHPRDPQKFALFRGFLGGDQYRSFPSGHSLAAFAVAATVTGEVANWYPDSKWIVGPVLYTGAALTGISRMFDNRHWATDVIVGAGLGTFAGLKVVRYHAAHPQNKVDRFFLNASIVPAGTDGHALRWSIMPAPPLDMRGR